ncbi:MAG: hypothetical protein JWN25_3446 [Verrucomicrobiales bacterium]|nr:hypothetical protein [Verrucomicrobiales bacterium]
MNRSADHQTLLFHQSQFPDAVRNSLHRSFQSRQMHHKFHYDSYKQTQKWLAVHQAYSPSRTDLDCLRIYEQAFAETSSRSSESPHLISLGCGGGKKDALFLKQLIAQGLTPIYTASDVSPAMVLTAIGEVSQSLQRHDSLGKVCDLAARPHPTFFETGAPFNGPSIYSFLGMIPNFEPQEVLPYLAQLLRPQDLLVFSANLAPGNDYRQGTQKILPLYNNLETKEWLQTILFDFGCDHTTGELTIEVEETPSGLLRINATYRFKEDFIFHLDDQKYPFTRGETFRLFFSYRYTDALIEKELAKYYLNIQSRWITNSKEEAVYLVSKSHQLTK